MQNIILVNQPTRVKVAKKFLESRGVQRYAMVKDSSELFEYLLAESCNVHIFDFYLDMSIINTLTDMKDSVNTVTVYTPDPKIGEPYLTLTDKIFIIPSEVDLLCWYWDSDTCNIQNVLACKASNKPFCAITLPNTSLKPTRIRVDIQDKKVPARYVLASGAVSNKKVGQLNINIKLKGKPLKDAGEVRKQDGIFEDRQRILDLPVVTAEVEGAYSGEDGANKKQKRAFSFPVFSFGSGLPKVPKELKVKPVKEPRVKPIKEPKVKPNKDTFIPIAIEDNTTMLPTTEEVKDIKPKKEKKPFGFKPLDKPVVLEGAEEKERKPKLSNLVTPKPATPKMESVELNVASGIQSNNAVEQEFGKLADKRETLEQANIDISEADSILEESTAAKKAIEKIVQEKKLAEEKRISEEKLAVIASESKASTAVSIQPVVVEEVKPKEHISVVMPTVTASSVPEEPVVRKKPNLRIGMADNVVYTNIQDYLFGNKMVDNDSHLAISKYVKENSKPGKAIRYGDIALERGLITADELVLATAKVFRLEVLSWKQLEHMKPNFEDFTKENCRELKFFRTEDDAEGNVQIIVSASANKIDSSIRRLFDSPHIRYTIEQYIDKKLE